MTKEEREREWSLGSHQNSLLQCPTYEKKMLARLTKKEDSNKIINQIGNITNNTTEIQRMIRLI